MQNQSQLLTRGIHGGNIPKFMPFFWLALACLSGILTADALGFSRQFWWTLAGICLCMLILELLLQRNRSSRYIPIALVCLVFSVAGLRFQVSQPLMDPSFSAWYNHKGIVEIIGVVTAPPEVYDNHTAITISVDSLTTQTSDAPLLDPDDIHGKILLQVLPGSNYAYGDLLLIRGQLITPNDSGPFSYKEYLERKGVYSTISYAKVKILQRKTFSPLLYAIYALNIKAQGVLRTIMPSPESDLLCGILLGNDNGLSPELQKAYQKTGTAHIIAISGFNIAILAGFITVFARRWFGPWKGLLAALVFLVGYTVLVGGAVSVVRAAIMGSLGMLGGLLGRKDNGLNTLGLAGLMMCLLNPNLPWDIGFQLSFAATLGMVIYGAPIQEKLVLFSERTIRNKNTSQILISASEFFIFTLAAQLTALPLIAYHFGNLSWHFLLVNPLILPIQPLVMIFGGVALLGGLVSIEIGKVLAWLAWPFAAYTNNIVSSLAGTATTSSSIQDFSFAWVILYYVVIFSLTLSRRQLSFLNKLTSPTTLVITFFCAVIITWSRVFTMPNGKLEVQMLPGSNNPVALVQSPEGRLLLMNGSIPASSLREAIGKKMKIFRQALDYVLIPSCRRDDVTALIGLEETIQIKNVAWACDPETIQTTKKLFQRYKDAGIPQVMLSPGDMFELGAKTTLTLVSGSKDLSLFTLSLNKFEGLVVFGASELIKNYSIREANILILPEPLSAESVQQVMNSEFQLVYFAVNNTSSEINTRIELMGQDLPVVMSKGTGAVWLRTDGEQLWVSSRSTTQP